MDDEPKSDVVKVSIQDVAGDYKTRREFELQLNCSDAQFAKLVAAVSQILCPATIK